MVTLVVGQQVKYGFLRRLAVGFRVAAWLMLNAYVADAAVGGVGLIEVAEQLSAPAHIAVGGVGQHGVHPLGVLLLTRFVDAGGYRHVFSVHPVLFVGDEGHLALRNEVKDMPVAEALQYEIHLLWPQSGDMGDEGLLDVLVIGEETSVASQHGRDDRILIRRVVEEPIELITSHEKFHASLCVRVCLIVDVSSVLQDMKGRCHAERVVAVDEAELVDVERECVSATASHAKFEEVGQVVVDIAHKLLGREGGADSPGELGLVATVPQEDGVGLLPVAPRSSRLLEVGLDGVGTVDMYHKPDVRLVDAHSKGIGGRHDTFLVGLP